MRTSTGSRVMARRPVPPVLPDPTIPRWIVPAGAVLGVILGLVTAGLVIVRI